jgi:hypothetical protein
MLARGGMPPYVSDTLPLITISQRPPKPGKLKLFTAKLQKAIKRGYFEEVDVWSFINMSDVTKGVDIRVIYNEPFKA